MAMTESDHSTIVGVFEDQAQADKSMNDLRTAGFSNDQINMEEHNASVGDENIPAGEPGTETQGPTTAGMIPSVYTSKTHLSRTVITVNAPGREQEALAILHRNGANNANIPDPLEAELAPILGTETDDTGQRPGQAIDTRSKDTFFSGPETSSTSGNPPAP
jgi:hypothetical protein